MNVKEFKELCQYASMGGLVNEFLISEGIAEGVNIEKTAVCIIEHKVSISQPIFISSIKDYINAINKYEDSQKIEVVDNKLVIEKDKYNSTRLALPIIEEPKFKVSRLSDESYQVIAKGIEHNAINRVGKLRTEKLMVSLYRFNVIDNRLTIQIGENNSSNVIGEIGQVQKCIEQKSIKFTADIPECCSNLKHNVDIYILLDNYILMECITESYKIQYFIAATQE